VDETYVRVKGQWRYLYGAVDASGAALDFLLSAKQDPEAARRFLAKALGRANHPKPRVIHTDGHGAYPPAITQLKEEGALAETCRHRVGHYLNNMVEQDDRAIKRRVKASQHFRSFWGAWRTLPGYAAVHMICKGQAFGCSAERDAVPLHAFIRSLFGFEG
jgi:transposase, IS6 family